MFLKEKILNSLMKQAYKTELVVEHTVDGWIYIAGNYWEAAIKEKNIRKETLADIVRLSGRMPQKGERIRVNKWGEEGDEDRIPEGELEKIYGGERELEVSNVILIGEGGTTERLLQEEGGRIYVVNNVFVEIVDNKLVDKDRGETFVEKPIMWASGNGIIWRNNVCRLSVGFRWDEKNGKILDQMQGMDITPWEEEW